MAACRKTDPFINHCSVFIYAVGVQLDGCLESINVCENSSITFSCSVAGEGMEWGNSSNGTDMRIQFSDDDPAGTRKQLATVMAVLTRHGDDGLASNYTLSISPGVRYGTTVIYCADRDDDDDDDGTGGVVRSCPPLAFNPGKSMQYVKLNFCIR